MIDPLDIGIVVLTPVLLATFATIVRVVLLELRSRRARRNALRKRGFVIPAGERRLP